MSDHINYNLNPSKYNFYDISRENYKKIKSMEEILNLFNIIVKTYYKLQNASDDHNFQIHMRSSTNSCFLNNYFKIGMKAWEVNMDIQPVFNEQKAIAYIHAYMNMSKDNGFNAMKQALKISIEKQM